LLSIFEQRLKELKISKILSKVILVREKRKAESTACVSRGGWCCGHRNRAEEQK
jgi:hypothetical protein